VRKVSIADEGSSVLISLRETLVLPKNSFPDTLKEGDSVSWKELGTMLIIEGSFSGNFSIEVAEPKKL